MNKQDLINFENRMIELYKDCKLPFLFHLSGGNEDQLIEIFKEVKEGDYVLSSHRNHYHALLHGIPPAELEEKIVDGRSMFIYDRKRNFFTSAIIGGTPAIAAGIAWALKRKGSTQKVWCFVGDGTEDSGHLFEAARYVDGWDLPCTFVVEDNNRSVLTTKGERWGTRGTSCYPIFPPCVRRYSYACNFPHCRSDDKIDLKRTVVKSDREYFPPLSEEAVGCADYSATKLSYKEAVVESMKKIAEQNGIFIGYNVRGDKGNAAGTLSLVNDSQKLETPVAENLMSGLGIGMSFEGFRPVVYFERHDFMLVAADAIGNHINHIERLSHGEFKVPVIIRAITADTIRPFYSGPTHSQDFTKVFRELVSFPVYSPVSGADVLTCYSLALASSRPSMVMERKSLF